MLPSILKVLEIYCLGIKLQKHTSTQKVFPGKLFGKCRKHDEHILTIDDAKMRETVSSLPDSNILSY